MNTDKLISCCPFCGNDVELISRGNSYTKKRSAEIKCSNCNVLMVVGAIRNDLEWCEDTVIKKWNTRAAILEAYKNQSSAVSDIGKEASNLAQTIYKNFENGFNCWADTQSLKEIIEMRLQKIIVSSESNVGGISDAWKWLSANGERVYSDKGVAYTSNDVIKALQLATHNTWVEIDVKKEKPPIEKELMMILDDGSESIFIFNNADEIEHECHAWGFRGWLKKQESSSIPSEVKEKDDSGDKATIEHISYNHFLAVVELMDRTDFPKNYYLQEGKEMWLKDVQNYFDNIKTRL